MLFSNPTVADHINQNFEAVWKSVRPVPMVTIDFGNDLVVKRTLHGNVATYVCNADGNLLDILPGIYKPATYRRRLTDLVKLHQSMEGNRQLAPLERSQRLAHYHQLQITAIENRTLSSEEEPSNWSSLDRDTLLNETTRRLAIHRHLLDVLEKDGRPTTPAAVTKWLYRDVLHADLNDPYLGLSKVLFDNYPFAEEDK